MSSNKPPPSPVIDPVLLGHSNPSSTDPNYELECEINSLLNDTHSSQEPEHTHERNQLSPEENDGQDMGAIDYSGLEAILRAAQSQDLQAERPAKSQGLGQGQYTVYDDDEDVLRPRRDSTTMNITPVVDTTLSPEMNELFSQMSGYPLHETQPVASTSNIDPLQKEKAKKSFPCSYPDCDKTFTRRSDLGRHMRIHTGERPFVCPQVGCGKTFIQRSAMQVHMRVHTGEKPHPCEYPGCDKSFGDSSSLARHRRTHTGRRPYQCEDPACEKTFTRRSTLTAHMRTHDPAWKPDPKTKYSFKSNNKRRKLSDNGNLELEQSVREISAIFQGSSSLDVPLDAQMATISAELAVALSQSRAGNFEEEEESDDGAVEVGVLGPNTSGIRSLREEEEEDSDTFPVPLRPRRTKDPVVIIGAKRKR